MNSIFALLPVFLFLFFLFFLDSFKLVVKKQLLLCIVWGIASATLAYFINTFTINQLQIGFDILSKYISPLVEELLKFAVIFVLITKKRVGFMIDAAIYGFAAGAGFTVRWPGFRPWLTQPLWPQSITQPLQKKTLKL